MNQLPAIGRPCKSGLSLKQLGRAEYQRLRYLMKIKSYKRKWTGLSAIKIGMAEYMKQWRKMRKELNCEH